MDFEVCIQWSFLFLFLFYAQEPTQSVLDSTPYVSRFKGSSRQVWEMEDHISAWQSDWDQEIERNSKLILPLHLRIRVGESLKKPLKI